MRRFSIWSVVFVLGAAVCIAAAPSAKTHYMTTEYQREQKGLEGITEVSVSFYETVSVEKMDAYMRAEVQLMASLYPPPANIKSIQITAFDKNDDMIHLADGNDYLIYIVAEKKILTQKEYEKTLKPSRQ